jgi:thiol-disulfide isomerase/thioredoxin
LAKCDQCEKEFGSRSALLQHYSAKHPGATPPQDLGGNETGSSKREERKGKNSRRRQSGRGRGKKFLLLGVLIAIAASIGVYALYPPHATNETVGINTGDRAADIPITLINGTTTTLGEFYGHPVLLWFIATWCPSCQQGAQLLASQYYSQLRSEGVILLTAESYNNLGQPGPSISQFADQYGGGSDKPAWLYGTTTQSATYTYNPRASLDIYYLIDRSGAVLANGDGLPAALQSISSTASGIKSLPTSAFPFQCLSSEGTSIHVHPWLRIVINGQNITVPADVGIRTSGSGSCFEPMHAHDSSGIIHIESPNANTPYALDDFFNIWRASYGSVTINGNPHPIIFTSTNILGFRADSIHKIVVLVDGQPSSEYGSLILNQLDYCSASSASPPCYPTASGNPYWNGQQYPHGTGHTILIEYVNT